MGDLLELVQRLSWHVPGKEGLAEALELNKTFRIMRREEEREIGLTSFA